MMWRALCISFLVLINGFVKDTEANESMHELKRTGLYVSALSDPFPSKIGINVSQNVLDGVRLSLGYSWPQSSTDGRTSAYGSTIRYEIYSGERVHWNVIAGLTRIRVLSGESRIHTRKDGYVVPVGFEAVVQTKKGLEWGLGITGVAAPSTYVAPSAHIGFFF